MWEKVTEGSFIYSFTG